MTTTELAALSPAIFISYASENDAVMRRVAEGLALAGFKDVVTAPDPTSGIRVGADWEQSIYLQLQRVACLGVSCKPGFACVPLVHSGGRDRLCARPARGHGGCEQS